MTIDEIDSGLIVNLIRSIVWFGRFMTPFDG